MRTTARERERERDRVGIAYGTAWDDLTGANLDPREASMASMKELGYIHDKSVYRRIPRSEALPIGIRILKTKWIDIDKGDLEHPNYRSRFVTMEFNTRRMDGLFASTPALEALQRFVVGCCKSGLYGAQLVQGGEGSDGERCCMRIFRGANQQRISGRDMVRRAHDCARAHS